MLKILSIRKSKLFLCAIIVILIISTVFIYRNYNIERGKVIKYDKENNHNSIYNSISCFILFDSGFKNIYSVYLDDKLCDFFILFSNRSTGTTGKFFLVEGKSKRKTIKVVKEGIIKRQYYEFEICNYNYVSLNMINNNLIVTCRNEEYSYE